MATRDEKESISGLNDRMTRMETRVDEIIIPGLNKVVQFVDDNKSGINLAQLLNNRIITLFLGAIVAAAIYFIAKGTPSL